MDKYIDFADRIGEVAGKAIYIAFSVSLAACAARVLGPEGAVFVAVPSAALAAVWIVFPAMQAAWRHRRPLACVALLGGAGWLAMQAPSLLGGVWALIH